MARTLGVRGSRRVRPPVRRPWVPLVVAISVLAACSGDDDSSSSTSSPGTSESPAATTAVPTETTASSGEPSGEPELTFGLLGPGVGLLDELVVGQERGLTLAIEDINAAGGVLGAPVASVRADESSGASIVSVLDELLSSGADVVVGPVGSASAIELEPVLAERALLACTASATAVPVTAAGRGQSLFRTALRDDHVAAYVAGSVMGGDAPPATVMVLGRDDTYGNELTGALAAELTARGAAVSTVAYPPRRVSFPEESAAVASAQPDRLIVAAFEEAPSLISAIVGAGYPADRIVGLDGMLVPRLAEQIFPSDPAQANGLTVIGSTGDRAVTARLREVEATQDQLLYGAQMYDCAVVIALAAIASGSTTPATIGQQVSAVTSGGRPCSTFAHCAELLAAGEDIAYVGATGNLGIDAAGDVSTARITTTQVIDGQLTATGSEDVDLEALRQQELFTQSVFTTRVQQGLKVLGYYEGPITGVYDEATAAAVSALQRDLGLPETGQYDEATDAALRERLGAASGTLTTSIAGVQQQLAALGYYTGPIDGQWSAATIDAVRAFQRDLGVPETGVIDAATLQAIYLRGQQSATPEPPPTTTTPPPTTEAPTTTAAPETTEAPPTTEAPATEPTLMDVLAGDERFTTLVELLVAVGYDVDLSQSGPITVFAPTNDAFELVDDDTLEALRDDPDLLAALLSYHGVIGALASTDLVSGPLTSIHGEPLEIVVSEGAITVNDATVIEGDLAASNGVIHVIDAVLAPPE